jgi:sugar/nucleoside kinase (ribokinase family)
MPDANGKNYGEIMLPGKLINVGSVTISTGGPVSNTGLALQKLGLNVSFIARVGDDDIGTLIIKRLEKSGNAGGIKIAPGEGTSYTVALAPQGLDRIFLHNPGTNDTFSSHDIDFDLVRQTRLFHLGYPPLMKGLFQNDGEELIKIFKAAQKTGVTTSLDMSLPDANSLSGKVNWRNILEKLLPYVDIFLPSIEEAFFMSHPTQYFEYKKQAGTHELIDFIEPAIYSQLTDEFIAMGAKIIGLKSAHRGLYLRTTTIEKLNLMGFIKPGDLENWADRELWCPAYKVAKIASATGSGDSSIAGFLSAFIRGFSVEKTLKFANCLGFQNLHELDALSGIKSWGETLKLVEKAELEMIRFQLDDPWVWNEKLMLWANK